MDEFDLLIVGGGIAGCEAARSAARGGRRTLLVSTSLDTLYNLAGDSVELEPPPGTLMGELAPTLVDAAGAVGGWALHRAVKYALESEPRLHLLQSSVSGLLVEGGAVVGVSTWEGVDRRAPRLALCVGSFLEARLSIGRSVEAAGRLSEMAYDDLYLDLERRGFGFEALTLEAPPAGGSLPYRVDCRVFAGDEWNSETFELARTPGLYAAGLCAAGYLSYEAAALQGLELGRTLAS